LLVRPLPEPAETVPAPAAPEPVFGAPIVGPMRGTVLLKLGDRIGADRVLPWGARVRPLRLRVGELARFAFAALDSGFAARAASHGGGWIVAGKDFGVGPHREQAGLVATWLGLRAMLARSFDPGFRRHLIQHGVLALQFLAAGDYDDIAVGDDLEIPDLPEGLEAGKPLVVRNLTRGAQYALHHDLDAAAVAMVRAGGLLAATRAALREASRC
jgi:aconitate hydratase